VLRELGVADADVARLDAEALAQVDALTERALAAEPVEAETAWGDVWSDGSFQWRN